MSEEIRIMLSRELRREDLQEITYNNLLTALAPLRNFLLKCLLERNEICDVVLSETLKIIRELSLIRVVKSLKGMKSELSFDSSFLDIIDGIIREYYNILMGYEAPYDEYNRVLVRVIKDFEHNGRSIKKNSIILLDAVKAVLLESLGFVKIYRIKVFK